jgi:hypothetical protein
MCTTRAIAGTSPEPIMFSTDTPSIAPQTACGIATLAALVALSVGAPATLAQGSTTAPWPTDEFCGRAQGYVTLASRPARNTLHEGYDSFRDSAASVQPLEAQQYTVADDAQGRARLISCKLVTAEALRGVYGPEAARTDSSCSLVNRNTFTSVLASLTPAERANARFGQGKKVAFDRDTLATSAAEWLEPGELATVDKRGTLHLTSRSWTGTEAGRGVRHCHFIAPDYARRLLLDGSLSLPATPVKR